MNNMSATFSTEAAWHRAILAAVTAGINFAAHEPVSGDWKWIIVYTGGH